MSECKQYLFGEAAPKVRLFDGCYENEHIFVPATKFNDHRRSSESFKTGERFFHSSFFLSNLYLIFCLQRFPSQNVSTLPREELLKLFSLYAVPKSRRITTNEIDVDMKPVTQLGVKRENGNKRSRHQLITAPTVETVTNACKKIRLINNERISINNKRHGDSTPMVWNKLKTFCFYINSWFTSHWMSLQESDDSHKSVESKRKKITWP